MNAKGEQVHELITEQAADWFVANRGGLTVKERGTFAAWLQESPVHVEEYLALSVIARDLRSACEDPLGSLDELLNRARLAEDTTVRPVWTRITAGFQGAASQLRQIAAVAAAAFLVLGIGLFAYLNVRPIANSAAYREDAALHFATRHGEQLTHRLQDNSLLQLNTDSAVTIRFSRKERLVTLSAGEADFEVAHESDRTFRVRAGSTEIVATGTNFNVRLAQESTVITVIQGRVAVGPAASAGSVTSSNPDSAPRHEELLAGQQISVVEGQWPPAKPVEVDSQRTLAWLRRQITFDHEPLAHVASEFNRYAPKPIEITTPLLRTLAISGVFATDDTAAFIAFLRSLEGVHVEETATQIRVSRE